tara:strand:+ start:2904 stop:3530 length:627 start_codon:yes stop_codon:yes gene_type:complete
MYKPEYFWNWFLKHQSRYLTLGEIKPELRDAAVDEMQFELNKFCDQIFFEIGGEEGDHRGALIISAAGDPDFFPQVRELVVAAPSMEDWEVIAFKPPHPGPVVITYEDQSFDPQEIIVIPLLHDAYLDSVGIQVCFDDFEEAIEEHYMGATFLMLEALIGEEAAINDIEHLEVCKVPADIEDIEHLMLSDIEDHIIEIKVNGLDENAY